MTRHRIVYDIGTPLGAGLAEDHNGESTSFGPTEEIKIGKRNLVYFSGYKSMRAHGSYCVVKGVRIGRKYTIKSGKDSGKTGALIRTLSERERSSLKPLLEEKLKETAINFW